MKGFKTWNFKQEFAGISGRGWSCDPPFWFPSSPFADRV